MLFDFYMEEEYMTQVLQLLDDIKHEGYYVEMAVIWEIVVRRK